jgi:hypothetical protein
MFVAFARPRNPRDLLRPTPGIALERKVPHKEIPMTKKKTIRKNPPVRTLSTDALRSVHGGLNFTKITF